jgi:hypothetical protein
MSEWLPSLIKLTSVPMPFITEVSSAPVVALLPRLPVHLWLCYDGYQCAYSCLSRKLPVCLSLLCTKATSVPMVACYQGHQCAYGCFVTKATSVDMVACYQGYQDCVSLICYQGYQCD